MKLWVALLAFLPSFSLAADIVARSGEHGNFSRLVFYSEVPVDPVLEEALGEVYLSVGPQAVKSLDATRVFDFIPRDRIVDLSVDRGRIKLSLGCQCSSVLHQVDAKVFYLDVSDRGDLVEVSGQDETIIVDRAMPQDTVRLPVLFSFGGSTDLAGSAHPMEDQAAENRDPVISAQGGVVPKPDFDPVASFSNSVSRFSLSARTLDAHSPVERIAREDLALNVAELSLFVRESSGQETEAAPLIRECTGYPGDDWLDFSDTQLIEEDGSFPGQEPLDISALSGEYPRIAKQYLSRVFLEEAEYFIELIDDSSQKRLLKAVANVVESDSEVLVGFSEIRDCTKLTSYWAFIEDGKWSPFFGEDVAAFLVFFLELPPEMQSALLERVEKNLQTSNLQSSADFLKNRENYFSSDTGTLTGVDRSSAMIESLVVSGFGGDVGKVETGVDLDLSKRLELSGAVHSLGDDGAAVEVLSNYISSLLKDNNWVGALDQFDLLRKQVGESAAIAIVEEDFIEFAAGDISDGELILLNREPTFRRILATSTSQRAEDVRVRASQLLDEVSTLSRLETDPADESNQEVDVDLLQEVDVAATSETPAEWSDPRFEGYQSLLDSSAELIEEVENLLR